MLAALYFQILAVGFMWIVVICLKLVSVDDNEGDIWVVLVIDILSGKAHEGQRDFFFFTVGVWLQEAVNGTCILRF
jgi:hypothetical protein